MAGLTLSLYCLPLIAIVFLCGASCEQPAHESLYSHEDKFTESFKKEFGIGAAYIAENNTEDEKLNAVLELLENIQTQIDELQTNVETVCSTANHRQAAPIVLRIVEKAKCPQHGKHFSLTSLTLWRSFYSLYHLPYSDSPLQGIYHYVKW